MRLDKFLSESTSLTRKEIKKLITDGAVSVNGSVVKAPETKVSESVRYGARAGEVCALWGISCGKAGYRHRGALDTHK